MSFPLIANGRVREAVLSAISAKKIPHAIIIEGEQGTGKKTLASFLAMAAVCSEGIACEKCANCHAAQTKNHPDIAYISALDGKKSISVNAIREMRSDAYVKPHQAAKKVFIINGADTMNEQSQNALLKVLEEPPGDIVFILIAESKHRMLATIISRCVLFSLSSPPVEQAAEYICEKNPSFSKESVIEALENNSGSIGQAMADLTGNKNEIKQSAEEFLYLAQKADEWEMLIISNPFQKDRISAERFSAQLKLSVAEQLKCANIPVQKKRRLLRFYEAIGELESSLKTNINLSLYFTLLASKAGEIFGGNL